MFGRLIVGFYETFHYFYHIYFLCLMIPPLQYGQKQNVCLQNNIRQNSIYQYCEELNNLGYQSWKQLSFELHSRIHFDFRGQYFVKLQQQLRQYPSRAQPP